MRAYCSCRAYGTAACNDHTARQRQIDVLCSVRQPELRFERNDLPGTEIIKEGPKEYISSSSLHWCKILGSFLRSKF